MKPKIDFGLRRPDTYQLSTRTVLYRVRVEEDRGTHTEITSFDTKDTLRWKLKHLLNAVNPVVVKAEKGELTVFQIIDSIMAENNNRAKLKRSRSQNALMCKRCMLRSGYVL